MRPSARVDHTVVIRLTLRSLIYVCPYKLVACRVVFVRSQFEAKAYLVVRQIFREHIWTRTGDESANVIYWNGSTF